MVARTPLRVEAVGLLVVALAALTAAAQPSDDLDQRLELARDLAGQHRYQEVVDLLAPSADLPLADELRYAVDAELGRALFHLGQYDPARQWLERAVAARPDRVETAIYLEGASYLSGHREQAVAILGELLRAGATDLFLAVTLTGQRSFLRDPAVWSTLEAHQVDLEMGLAEGRFRSVRLGQQRAAAEQALGGDRRGSGAASLVARAGPKQLWVLSFADDGRLREILVDADSLLRYTPFRLRLGEGLDWRATPQVARALLGPPERTTGAADDLELLTWRLGQVTATLGFGPPVEPRPLPLAGAATSLRLVVLQPTPGF